MNVVRLAIACVIGFVFIWTTDFVIHGIWLKPTYEATKELWRPEEAMLQKLPFMFGGQALVGVAFAVAYIVYAAEKRSTACAMLFGFLFSLVFIGGQSIMYCVQPYPGHLVVKWCLAGTAQMVILGLILSFVYRPAPAKSP